MRRSIIPVNAKPFSPEIVQFKDEFFLEELDHLSGPIDIPLRNDICFHCTLQRCPEALRGLTAALKHWDVDEIREVRIGNPIDYGQYSGKEIIIDVRVTLNSNEQMVMELQMYRDRNWIPRSLLYLSRAFDTLEAGEYYDRLIPTTMVAILPFDQFPDTPQYYASNLLTNSDYGYVYSRYLSVNVLSLNRIELATETDRKYGLDLWGKLLLAKTWEEVRELVRADKGIMEAAKSMYAANIAPEERTLYEAHRRYVGLVRDLERQNAEDKEALAEAHRKYEEVKRDLERRNTEDEKALAEAHEELGRTRSELEEALRANEELKRKLQAVEKQNI